MRENPVISVLMSTYNTPEEWLSEAIESILNQTFSDFEFLIVDDCSTQSVDNVKNKYTDSRIKWIHNEKNLGLTKSLNKILKMAKGNYIARMDSDDIALPERLATQIDFMEAHPEVIVSGSYRRAFGNEEKDEIWNIPVTREEQQVQLFFSNVGLTHPTAMFRKSMLDEYEITYNENYIKAQDYGIWVQCTRYAPMHMIPKVLLLYRKSEIQISTAGRKNQLEMDALIKLDQLKALGVNATNEEKLMHIGFCRNDTNFNPDKMERWIQKLLTANAEYGYLDKTIFVTVLKRRWYIWCRKAYKEEGKMEAKSAYRRAITFSDLMKDIKIAIKQWIVRIIRK